MHDLVIRSGWDAFLIGAPMVGMLVIGFFRLDETFANRGRRARRRRRVAGLGSPVQCPDTDPDGRPWPLPRSKRFLTRRRP